MNEKQFRRYRDRDGDQCAHCGTTETLVPGHRLGRGHGGSKLRDVPSNILTMCHWLNNELESNADLRAQAREAGWSLVSGQDPKTTPFWDENYQSWFLLDDNYGRVAA